MFFCNSCAKKYEWPTSLFGSYGACELCNEVTHCNDVPSRALPNPKPKPKPELDIDSIT